MPKGIGQMWREHSNKALLKDLKKKVEEVNAINLKSHRDEELQEKSRELIRRAKEGAELEALMSEAFALCKEVSKRILSLEAYDEQLMAGMAMHQGRLVEMQTGEGKTLAAIFPAYLNALSGKGVHILTFNDYLANRDANWMGPVFSFLGLSVGCIQESMNHLERKQAYNCHITYVTAKEAGFDYLRDFLCVSKEQLIHRDFNFAIVDEADSILIDEARIPLVIATDEADGGENLSLAKKAVEVLKPEIHFKTDEYANNVYLTEEGIAEVESILVSGNLYSAENYKLLSQVNLALQALVLYHKDVDYIVREGKVELVDEFTGRVADNRHWPDGLQAAVEAKENLVVRSKGRILAQMAIQSFIKLYKKLSGMTGTAVDSSEEFRDVYDLELLILPTHEPCIRKDYPSMVFTHKDAKLKAVVQEIVRVHLTGQPILVGTSSVKESLLVASALEKAEVECQVLNAKNDELEAHIIAQAGRVGAVTVSTNMAGRGTDIKLGGALEEERDQVVALGGLYVIGTNHYESRRIDKQLSGRAGRQGDPGSSRFFVSLEDDLLKKYGVQELIPKEVMPESQEGPILNPVIVGKIDQVQRIIQGQISDFRLSLRNYSSILEEQRMLIHERRMDIVKGTTTFSILEEKDEKLYSSWVDFLGEEQYKELEKHITLYHINKCWADYLDEMNFLREGIHLAKLGGKDPFITFKMDAANAFINLQERIEEGIARDFTTTSQDANGVEELKSRLKMPESTWTYLVNDSAMADSLGIMFMGNTGMAALGATFGAPFVAAAVMYEKFFRKRGKESK